MTFKSLPTLSYPPPVTPCAARAFARFLAQCQKLGDSDAAARELWERSALIRRRWVAAEKEAA